MTDPYLVLGVSEDADDAAIHAAYLAAIKACPPERDARRFEAIRTAYQSIRTPKDRLAHELFDATPPGPLDVLDRASPVGAPQRPDAALFAVLLRGER
jgi:curved DNA-binding protein CbpA